jgi:amidophosphoribosyltransferase
MDADRSLGHECGIFAMEGDADAARLTYLGLHALQHRGHEAAGIVARDGETLRIHKGEGRVHEVFDDAALRSLPGDGAMGHVRYATAGGGGLVNAQPFLVTTRDGSIALAHNGNLTNARALRAEMEARGAVFTSTSDTEVILHLFAASEQKTTINRLVDALRQLEGAFCLLMFVGRRLIAVRDPWGFRPLVLGRRGDTWIVASETCAVDFVRGEVVREIEPGEMLVIEDGAVESLRPFARQDRKACIFEYIYFARPDSVLFGHDVHEARVRMGEVLAQEYPARADVVVPVPDSGVPAALGFARVSGLPYAQGLLRNQHVGRTFIEPTQRIRDFGVRLKLAAVPAVVRGKRVVVIDDSIVRGTTSQKIVRLLREAGALEVHVRISSPPMTGPCHYGIDTPDKDQLVAARMDVGRIRALLDCDSLAYLSIADLRRALAAAGRGTCDACFTGDYPLRPNDPSSSAQVPLFPPATPTGYTR